MLITSRNCGRPIDGKYNHKLKPHSGFYYGQAHDEAIPAHINPPYNFHQLAHCDVVWHKELCLVKEWQVSLPRVPLNDDGDFVGVLLTYLFHILLSLGCNGRNVYSLYLVDMAVSSLS